jgi:DNA-binding protein YbaB
MEEWQNVPSEEEFLGLNLNGSTDWKEVIQTPTKRKIGDEQSGIPEEAKKPRLDDKENSCFMCPVEELKFNSYQNLVKHWRKCHEELCSLFICPVGKNQCNALLKRYDLQKHLTSKHKLDCEKAKMLAGQAEIIKKPNRYYQNPGSHRLPERRHIMKPHSQEDATMVPEALSTSRDCLLKNLKKMQEEMVRAESHLKEAQEKYIRCTKKYHEAHITLSNWDQEEVRSIKRQLEIERGQRRQSEQQLRQVQATILKKTQDDRRQSFVFKAQSSTVSVNTDICGPVMDFVMNYIKKE